jgi:hypothetical protein
VEGICILGGVRTGTGQQQQIGTDANPEHTGSSAGKSTSPHVECLGKARKGRQSSMLAHFWYHVSGTT